MWINSVGDIYLNGEIVGVKIVVIVYVFNFNIMYLIY